MSTISSTQACAACKYQRRKCTPDCPLAPYFPPDQPKQFLNVHRLFGVSNVLRILRQVTPSLKADAIKSIVYEADAWERDPVHGCLGLISILQNQVDDLQLELVRARSQIFFLEQSNQINTLHSHIAANPSLISTNSGSLGGTSQIISDFGPPNVWVFSNYIQPDAQPDVEGSAILDVNASSCAGSGGLRPFDPIVEHNHHCEVETEEASTYELHEADSTPNRSDCFLHEGSSLTPKKEQNTNARDDEDGLKKIVTFSLIRH
ncbi:hypothetical protein GOP47_0016570 [Adiantum capillus-veneris]|uniref:LOB domain-containing protein n=1 Tax=Adiantum capillus-veneris TaxID=13818 RepID=A0A9D4UHY4_ADICA|nr:hypothetical protein GOP47_0016570 [Adiantum capillus-veneris]